MRSSHHAAAASSESSRPCGAASCNPIGSPCTRPAGMLIAGNPRSDHSEQHDGSPVVSSPRGAVLGADGASTASYSSSHPVKNAMRALARDDGVAVSLAPDRVAIVDRRVDRGREAIALARLQRAQHFRPFLQHQRAVRGLRLLPCGRNGDRHDFGGIAQGVERMGKRAQRFVVGLDPRELREPREARPVRGQGDRRRDAAAVGERARHARRVGNRSRERADRVERGRERMHAGDRRSGPPSACSRRRRNRPRDG